MFQFSSYGLCHIGLVRTNNEDNLLIAGKMKESSLLSIWESGLNTGQNTGLFAVSDGMGGEADGEWAAWTAIRQLQALCHNNVADIIDCYSATNNEICVRIIQGGGRRIGATCVSLSLHETVADLVNIGDSRGYLLRAGELTRLSHDHTELQSKFDIGIPLAVLEKDKKSQNTLTQHLGIFPYEMEIEPFIKQNIPLFRGDIYLLCSDGLTAMVDDCAIKEIVSSSAEIDEKCHLLLATALNAGGKDNISIILVEIREI